MNIIQEEKNKQEDLFRGLFVDFIKQQTPIFRPTSFYIYCKDRMGLEQFNEVKKPLHAFWKELLVNGTVERIPERNCSFRLRKG